MFEVITQTQPDDYQSLEILKVAYQKLGKTPEAAKISRRLAEAYYNVGSFSLAMQEYLYAVTYVAPRTEKVVTVGLATALIRGDIFYWGSLMAGALVVGLPIALLYSVVLDRFIEGLTGVGTSQ